MAQYVPPANNGGLADGAADPAGFALSSGLAAGPPNDPRRSELQQLLAHFDAQINSMMDYPAKDTINALTKMAERREFAPEIVSFLETKIHRVPPQYKLPIFYLTDSILKNVRDPYIALLARNIVPLYCNCVRQVSGKDLKRFVHVLNTWGSTQLFSKEALLQMRTAANRALATAEPVAVPQPASFAATAPPTPPAPQQDMELRSLLTQMQNDMGFHPAEHLSLEQVRVQNPAWYNQLVEYVSSTKQQAPTPAPVISPIQPAAPASDPRRDIPAPVQRKQRPSRFSDAPPQSAPVVRLTPARTPAQSANVAHLMDLLKSKKQAPPRAEPEQPIITNEHPPAPNAASVLSILQRLKGMNSSNTGSGDSATAAPPPAATGKSDSAPARMWFSDKIVAHKDRVESNVQKLYAALPLVCRESGLRFKEQDKLNAHLDFLFQYNRAQKERGVGGISRSWFPDETQWESDFGGDAPREATSSSFFDRQVTEEEVKPQAEKASVPVDEAVTRCWICGGAFSKSWDEDEEEWMYTDAVYGTIHDESAANPDRKTIFHKYCHDTVMANSKHVTPEHLIPGTPPCLGEAMLTDQDSVDMGSIKRSLEEDDSDDEDDVKRIKTA